MNQNYGFNPNFGLMATEYIKSLYPWQYHALIDFGLIFLEQLEKKYKITINPLKFIKELIEQETK
jgi:hypothetical protein